MMDLLSKAHYQSTLRQNPSTVALQCAAHGTGDLFRSVAAALVCFGGSHGPIEKTYMILADDKLEPASVVEIYRSLREKVPGWGSSFTKGGEPDPIWDPFDKFFSANYPHIYARMMSITKALHDSGWKIDPNPSAYTAGAAIVLGMPRRLAPYLLIIGRIEAWADVFLAETKGT